MRKKTSSFLIGLIDTYSFQTVASLVHFQLTNHIKSNFNNKTIHPTILLLVYFFCKLSGISESRHFSARQFCLSAYSSTYPEVFSDHFSYSINGGNSVHGLLWFTLTGNLCLLLHIEVACCELLKLCSSSSSASLTTTPEIFAYRVPLLLRLCDSSSCTVQSSVIQTLNMLLAKWSSWSRGSYSGWSLFGSTFPVSLVIIHLSCSRLNLDRSYPVNLSFHRNPWPIKLMTLPRPLFCSFARYHIRFPFLNGSVIYAPSFWLPLNPPSPQFIVFLYMLILCYCYLTKIVTIVSFALLNWILSSVQVRQDPFVTGIG